MKLGTAVILLILLSSCSFYFTDGDYFFISREDAVLPVWVKGNTESGVFIIFNHGGPGETASYVTNFKAMQALEEDYALVYWDQRCSGISQGNPSTDSFTLEDFIADLDLLVDTIEYQYSPNSIFLYGVSWGGTLGTAYLTDSIRQQKISGFIEEGGGHNMVLLMELSSGIIQDHAEAMVAEGNETDFWQDAVDFFAAHPDSTEWTAEDYYEYASYLRNADPYTYETDEYPDEYAGPGGSDIFLSPISFALFFNPGKLVPNFNILSLNLNPDMGFITLPVLLLWGEYDINSPAGLADKAEAFLGTPPADLRKVIIPNAGHNTFIDQPDTFISEVETFIEANK